MKGIEYYRSKVLDMIEIKTCSDDLHSYKNHIHQELSIGYIQKGSTMLNINGKDYKIKAGEAVIIYPYVSHKCQPIDINNWEFTMIYIDNKFCKEIVGNLTIKNSIGVKKLGNDEFNKIKYIADILKSDVSRPDKEVALINIINEIFDTCEIDIQFQSSKKMNWIKKYIEHHFLDMIQLTDIEDTFNVNKFSLIRNFKSKFNTTPNAYQLQLKIDYAKNLIKKGGSIVDIALEAGFYDQPHFTKEFKKAYGITPLKYQKSLI
ncbi:AraC family transcriptional regulator [Marinisporobacter balticus]|uniref:AraC-like DNA-binding protein n=1 Tax=Marinisporobacter balticus TaxID=2018667 RepID=A0A4V2S9V1_9FIRM|nr:AraC family transcriptional regulator [Marinisporobacter balticus]TCO68800.1 AraC-like DNA-binding protein [Marinisporobacter balticus]